MTDPLRLERDAVHLDSHVGVVPLPGFDHDYDSYIAAHCTHAAPGRLVSLGTSTEHWPSWETHPAGDELVIVISGRAEFIQELADGKRVRSVVGPKEAIINPAGVPHTANVLEAFTAIYVTPCPGTTHRPRSIDDV
jgi:mannose-6-phosphate isomerase-like protein (cupin superfamily)